MLRHALLIPLLAAPVFADPGFAAPVPAVAAPAPGSPAGIQLAADRPPVPMAPPHERRARRGAERHQEAAPDAAVPGVPSDPREIVSGFFDVALRAAASIRNLPDRFQAGLAVGRAQAEGGETAGARDTFTQLAAAANAFVEGDRNTTDDRRVTSLVAVAKAQCEVGLAADGRATLATARGVAGGDASRLAELLDGQGACGDASASATRRRLDSALLGLDGDAARADIVPKLAAFGLYENAQTTADAIEDPLKRAEALLSVARAMIGQDQGRRADPILTRARRAAGQAKADERDAAKRLENRIAATRDDPELTMAAFTFHLAESSRLLAAGDGKGAVAELNRADRRLDDVLATGRLPADGADAARRDLAAHWAAAGDAEVAQKVAAKIKDERNRMLADGQVLAARARRGDVAPAEAAVTRLTGEARIVAAIGLLGGYQRTGQPEKMRRTVAAVVPDIQNIGLPLIQAIYFADAGKTLDQALRGAR